MIQSKIGFFLIVPYFGKANYIGNNLLKYPRHSIKLNKSTNMFALLKLMLFFNGFKMIQISEFIKL